MFALLPAGVNVWQPVHPLDLKAAAPAVASPCAVACVDVVGMVPTTFCAVGETVSPLPQPARRAARTISGARRRMAASLIKVLEALAASREPRPEDERRERAEARDVGGRVVYEQRDRQRDEQRVAPPGARPPQREPYERGDAEGEEHGLVPAGADEGGGQVQPVAEVAEQQARA